LLVGGYIDAALRRAARYADGWTQGGGTPDALAEGARKLDELWHAEGREGSPYKLALFYFGLGDGAEQQARADLSHYYAWLGEETANQIVAAAATDPETIKGYLSAFEQAGANEVICFPVSADPHQVDLLADVAL
jgi:alkanesulfonate monooxygenase SsuD/methylene tetrahydromethanopterin reductase-like flavin-dependent oxidoreductase (luciferase family)